MTKRILAIAIIATLILALGASAALAAGYNTPTQYTRANGYFSGPHGGYTTTTNKCADCHSTHYAMGSFMLLRANSREAACDYCHGGGGGSSINIMMDNEYKDYVDGKEFLDGVADPNGGSGMGTGHTLGYTGNAPADINPAFTSSDGFACFDCHSPHGNSARIMTTFGNPGRAFAAPGQEGRPTTAALNANTEFWPIKAGFGSGDKDALLENGEWGVDYVYGNFVWDGNGATAGMAFRYRPIWPSGRFLLLKDPHSTADEGEADTVVAALGDTADDGVNKYMIDWDDPMGPADGTYGGYQDNDSNQSFPFATVGPNGTVGNGFLAESEMCVDCHDGTGGASTQAANVWQPAGVSGSATGAYAVAFSHDTQPRH